MLPPVFKESFLSWRRDNVSSHAASVSFFALLSIAPILVIGLGLAGLFFDPTELERGTLTSLQGIVGIDGARVVVSMLESSRLTHQSILAYVIGVAVTLFAGTKVLQQLRLSVNQIWGIELKSHQPVTRFFFRKLLSMLLILSFGALLVSLVTASAFMHAAFTYIQVYLPGIATMVPIADVLLSLVVTIIFCMLLFMLLPDAAIDWRDALAGAAFTGLILTIGKTIISLYLAKSGVVSTYGIAGSVIAILLWLYLSALIFFLGVEFTHTYARLHGHKINPKVHAQEIVETMGFRQWIFLHLRRIVLRK